MSAHAVLAALAALAFPLAPSTAAQELVVRGRVVYTMAGPPIQNGVVWIRDGKIVAVGPAADIELPSGLETLSAAVVTPGLVDAHSVVGLAGWQNLPHVSDQLENSAPIQPELDARDAYNPRELLIGWLRGFGVTTIHTGHAPGALVAGQTLIAKTRGDTVEEALIVPHAMVAATLGPGALRDDAPGTRSKAVALLRAELIRARAYDAKRAGDEPPDRDLRLETLARVLRRELPLLVTVHRSHDIQTALRLAREFELELVLDGAAECYLLLDEIAAAGVPVLLHPTMARANGETENLAMDTALTLATAQIPFALQSGYEPYVPKTRVVLFEAAIACAWGLPFERALASITIDAARILGIDARLGSLEVGKDGDVALFDGDPFETTNHCIGVVIEGEVVSREVR